MSFEQQEYNREEEKKRQRKQDFERDRFFESQKMKLESEELLEKLAKEIAKEFGITLSEAKSLIEEQSNEKLLSLKAELREKNENFNEKRLDTAIKQAKKDIESQSTLERKALLESLKNKIFSPETDTYYISRSMFSPEIIERAIHPQTLTDQMIGAGIGTIDSIEAILLFLWGLAKGILLTPYHIYQMILKK